MHFAENATLKSGLFLSDVRWTCHMELQECCFHTQPGHHLTSGQKRRGRTLWVSVCFYAQRVLKKKKNRKWGIELFIETHNDVDEFSASPTAVAAPFPVRQPPLVVSFHSALVVKRNETRTVPGVCVSVSSPQLFAVIGPFIRQWLKFNETTL